VVTLNATAVLLTLSGFYLVLRFAPLPAVGIPFLFGLAELGRFVVALVPLILLMPAILLYVGSRGRSFKEAQSNLSVLLFVVSLIPIVQMFLQRKEPAWLTWIPISGQYALLSRALRGEALPSVELLQSYAVPALLTFFTLVAVARLFSRESVLAGK
jgi:sodium transport system permease protein